MKKIVLASESPRRREILASLGLNFTTCSSKIEEVFDSNMPLSDALMQIAYAKAKVGLNKYPNDIILGADTIVVVDDKILGKPKSREEAKSMLESLSGRKHDVYTGVALLYKDHKDLFYEKTEVTFYELENELIESYLDSKEYKDKAGAYGIQGKGCILVKEIKGDYFNVVGLPVSSVYRHLLTYLNTKD